jgi:hypothetical protein
MGAYGGTAEASLSPARVGSPADLDGDGRVDFRDCGAFATTWLSTTAPRREDFNRDGAVNFVDFAVLSSGWLCPAHQ